VLQQTNWRALQPREKARTAAERTYVSPKGDFSVTRRPCDHIENNLELGQWLCVPTFRSGLPFSGFHMYVIDSNKFSSILSCYKFIRNSDHFVENAQASYTRDFRQTDKNSIRDWSKKHALLVDIGNSGRTILSNWFREAGLFRETGLFREAGKA
jgi:hypothetical protein